jgi:hypothetical protein
MRENTAKTGNGEGNDMGTTTVFKPTAVQKKALLKEPEPWRNVRYKPENMMVTPGKGGDTL